MFVITSLQIMFFQLLKCRVAFKRKFFGDRFWLHRPLLASRFFELQCPPGGMDSIDQAHVETARAIVLDYEEGTPVGLNAQPTPSYGADPAAYVISELACMRMKSALGYREARALIMETGFQWNDSQIFLDIPQTPQEDQRHFDSKVKRDFVYNCGTGFRAWVETYVGRDGTLLREHCYRGDTRHLEYTKHLIDGDDIDDEDDDDSSGYYYTDSEVGSRSTRVTRKSKATKKSRRSSTKRTTSVVSAKQSAKQSKQSSSVLSPQQPTAIT